MVVVVVALPAAAVEAERLPAVTASDVLQARGDLIQGRIPADRFVGPVRAASHRSVEAVRTALIVLEPQRLFTRVALRAGMLLVAADLGQPPSV